MIDSHVLPRPEARVNDFVARFANVNGTGSASANFLFAKAIFRMGIPVTPKNIFPSNIQGLPTWYEVRVSEKGYLGRREGIDLLVAVNAQSMKQDIASVREGGYLMYDSTKKLAPELIREGIHYLGVPMMELANEHFTNPRQRQLFKNIIYVGALSVLLQIDYAVLETLLQEQFAGKEKLIAPNLKALRLGMDHAREHFDYPLDFYLERRNLIGDKILVDGNSACGLGAVFGGATVMAWYPITPSTSVAEAFEKYASRYRVDPETGKNRFAVIQAEDELSAMGMVIGANWNGARALTATSGPGVSLMNEFIGLAYFAEVPAVLIDVQRAGPSTGMPTRTQQSDITLAAYASHGDSKHPLLFPATPKECFEMTAACFDLADRLQTPVILMTDLDLGMNDHLSEPFHWPEGQRYDRGKVLSQEELDAMGRYGRYLDVDGDGIPYRTYPGTHPTKGAFTTRGTSRDEYAVYTEDSAAYKRNMDRLLLKWETTKRLVPKPEFYQKHNQSDWGMVFFGTSTFSSEEARDLLAARGMNLDALRIKAFPFGTETEAFVREHPLIFVIEQNRDGQMRSLLIQEMQLSPRQLISVLNYDGMPITADQIALQIADYFKQTNTLSHDVSETSI
ncbi:2-oxoglutarate ferredoxin oxidoreductase subunit alpha [Cyclobacterium xiamenense]|uniref:2-oxoglutarate ferredoxin oxidoreductase subunit alpha n=1 Tax=Cyclobacterium xiamenense TaxID=1297121 RepID=A0A1H6ZHJ7_9BACT|nr:2-oxoacid:acceptor oxidoreductase subunit alpha [Cyclobacterium xiamenense]SEJ49152.1 2-oxoglutarate ferredoxin oxidoreductase subunit alpha [Cyclobacterium xiamenense]